MPERRFDTEYWTTPSIVRLPWKAKFLYAYLWTNIHCNQAGLYAIAVETISSETGLPVEEIPELLERLAPKVAWYPDQDLVWVKSFLRRQNRSPLFLAAAARCLESINNNGLIKEFIEYNKKYTLSIPYQYPINRLEGHTIPTTLTDTLTKRGRGVVKGGGETDEDSEIIEVWQSVKGFAMEPPAMVELISKIRADFQDVDILAESKKWAARKLSEPLTKASRPSSQIYNFMANRHKWNQEKKGGAGGKGSKSRRAKGAIKYIKGAGPAGPEDT